MKIKYFLDGVKIVMDNTIRAVHDDDILSLITSLGLASDFEQGNCKCMFCDSTITQDNFSAIFPHNGKVQFCCNLPECEYHLLER